ncbi:MAG: DUF4760 domain-containing protein [Candidatus Tyrphobacter sp.]
MELATLLNIVSTLALVGALIFAGLQIRAGNRVRDEQATIKLIEAALGAVLAQPATLLADVSSTVSSADVVNVSQETLRAIQETGFRLEALGYLVFVRVVSVQSVEELMGGLIALWWSRIKPYAEYERQRTGNPRMYEWVQWLAERIAERRRNEPAEPAFVAHASWR